MLFNTILLSAKLDGIQNQLDKIYHELETIQRTSPDYSKLFAWDVGLIASISLAVAIFSLVYTYRAFKSQVKTEENTSNVTSEAIKGWLKDLIRHFYRNLVVVTAIKKKLDERKENGMFTGYPSDEHILKLAPSYDWLEMVNNKELSNIQNGVSLFNLKKLFVNFDIEIHTSLEHFKSRDIPMEVKQRDLTTLMFKSKFLAYKSYEAFCIYIHYLEKPQKRHSVSECLHSICNAFKNIPKCFIEFFTPTKDNDEEDQINATLHDLNDKTNYLITREQTTKYDTLPLTKEERDRKDKEETEDNNKKIMTMFANIFCNGDMEQFKKKLEYDVEVECGNNYEGSPKIFIIKYTENTFSEK